jgi:hypothetical protein
MSGSSRSDISDRQKAARALSLNYRSNARDNRGSREIRAIGSRALATCMLAVLEDRADVILGTVWAENRGYSYRTSVCNPCGIRHTSGWVTRKRGPICWFALVVLLPDPGQRMLPRVGVQSIAPASKYSRGR